MRRVPGCAIGAAPWKGSPEAWESRWRTVEPGGPAGSSRSIVPSSAATSTARAVTSFVTDAQRSTVSRGPRAPSSAPCRSSTATATVSAGHASTSFSASTAADTTRTRRRIFHSRPNPDTVRARTRKRHRSIPATITGTAASAGGSVLDHRFGQSEPYTLGVEEEYMLLDPDSFDLVQHIDTVLAAIQGHELESQINAELMQSVLEIATPVCRTAADVDQQLRLLRGYVGGIAREQGLRFGSAGTHPFSLFERQRITARTATGTSSTSSSTSPAAS